MWSPVVRPNDILPCVIYMHGNSSARVEALPQLALILSLGAILVAFDFTGSGQSEGDYVSLGYFERDDLDCVIEHLRNSGEISTIALWGRSMGAATALLHGERDPSIAGMVLDSAFASLHILAEEMVEKGKEHGVNVPGFIVRMAIK
jgi:pimeloyl-ACP methyl ester carboxylesterase